jgi:hypothetical protein
MRNRAIVFDEGNSSNQEAASARLREEDPKEEREFPIVHQTIILRLDPE